MSAAGSWHERLPSYHARLQSDAQHRSRRLSQSFGNQCAAKKVAKPLTKESRAKHKSTLNIIFICQQLWDLWQAPT